MNLSELKSRGVEIREEIVVKGEKVEEITPEENALIENKLWEQELDGILERIKASERKSRERSLVITKLEEALMWLDADGDKL